MSKGRKNLPAEIKKLRGTAQPCRDKVADGGTVARLSEAKPPVWLDADAKKVFKMKADQLIALRVLTVLDIDLLALYAQAYSMIIEALRKIREDGKFCTVHNDEGNIAGFIENPYLKVYRDNFDRVQKLASHFGFSPATRKDILALVADKQEKKNEFAEFE